MNWVLGTVVGAASGILASMGLGGGFVLLIYMMLFTDTGQVGSQGLNLMFFLPVVAVSVVLHIKNKLIDLKKALIIGGFGALAVPAGYFLASSMDDNLLRRVFAVFLIIAGCKDLFFGKNQDP